MTEEHLDLLFVKAAKQAGVRLENRPDGTQALGLRLHCFAANVWHMAEHKNHKREAALAVQLKELEAKVQALTISGAWVSVKDRLPENNTECLVWKEPRTIGFGHSGYVLSTFEDGKFSDIYGYEEVTHWQLLQKPQF